ncbi:hypothetical protein LCGC14_2767790, partial [marine sediment metagenome]
TRQANTLWKQTNRGKRSDRERAREYRKLPRYKATGLRHARKYQAKYPEKLLARQMVQKAVKHGFLIRPAWCQKCHRKPERSLHAHHHKGYHNPLIVRWLCVRCHNKCHQKPKAQEVADER